MAGLMGVLGSYQTLQWLMREVTHEMMGISLLFLRIWRIKGLFWFSCKKRGYSKKKLIIFAVLCIAKSRRCVMKFCFSSSVWCIILRLYLQENKAIGINLKQFLSIE